MYTKTHAPLNEDTFVRGLEKLSNNRYRIYTKYLISACHKWNGETLQIEDSFDLDEKDQAEEYNQLKAIALMCGNYLTVLDRTNNINIQKITLRFPYMENYLNQYRGNYGNISSIITPCYFPLIKTFNHSVGIEILSDEAYRLYIASMIIFSHQVKVVKGKGNYSKSAKIYFGQLKKLGINQNPAAVDHLYSEIQNKFLDPVSNEINFTFTQVDKETWNVSNKIWQTLMIPFQKKVEKGLQDKDFEITVHNKDPWGNDYENG